MRGSETPIVYVRTLDDLHLSSPIETKILLPGPKGSFLEFHLGKAQAIPAHRFAHDTVCYLLSGRARVQLAGDQSGPAPRSLERGGWGRWNWKLRRIACSLSGWGRRTPHVMWGTAC
jgi:hypothetical protein